MNNQNPTAPVQGFRGGLTLQEINEFLDDAPNLEQLEGDVQSAQCKLDDATDALEIQMARGAQALKRGLSPFKAAVEELQMCHSKLAHAIAKCDLERALEILEAEKERQGNLTAGLKTLLKTN